jgi:hypothetical protein
LAVNAVPIHAMIPAASCHTTTLSIRHLTLITFPTFLPSSHWIVYTKLYHTNRLHWFPSMELYTSMRFLSTKHRTEYGYYPTMILRLVVSTLTILSRYQVQ